MDKPLAILLLALGLAGWLGSVLTPSPLPDTGNRGERRGPAGFTSAKTARESVFSLLAGGFAAAIFLVTLPSRPPFAPGSSLGAGVLLGAGALLFTARLRRDDRDVLPILWAGVLSLGLTELLWDPARVSDTRLGVCAGILFSGLLLATAAGESAPWSKTVLKAVLFTQVLGVASILGSQRTDLTAEGATALPWALAALWTGAFVPLGLALARLLPGKDQPLPGFFNRVGGLLWDEDAPYGVAGLTLTGLLTLAAAALLSLRLLDEARVAQLFLFGLGTGFLLLALGKENQTNGNTAVQAGLHAPYSALVMVVAFIGAFGVMQGYGAAIMLLGAAVPMLAAPAGRGAGAARILYLGLGFLLFRVFGGHYTDELRGFSLADNYALFGTTIGVLAPLALASVAFTGDRARLLHTVPALLLCAGIPVACVVFYGPRIGLSLSAGLALAAAVRGPRTLPLWATGTSLVLLVITGHLTALGDLTRADKLRLLLLAASATAIVLVLADLLARRERTAQHA